MESLSGLFDQVCQSMVLRWALFHSLFYVDIDSIHKLTFGQVDFLCYPRCPVILVHNVGEGNVTFFAPAKKETDGVQVSELLTAAVRSIKTYMTYLLEDATLGFLPKQHYLKQLTVGASYQ